MVTFPFQSFLVALKTHFTIGSPSLPNERYSPIATGGRGAAPVAEGWMLVGATSCSCSVVAVIVWMEEKMRMNPMTSKDVLISREGDRLELDGRRGAIPTQDKY